MTSLETAGQSKFRKGLACILLMTLIVSSGALGLAGFGPAGTVQERSGPPPSGGPAVPGEGPAAVGGSSVDPVEALGGRAEDSGAGGGAHPLTDSELNLLARLISAEARGEPFLGQVAVGAVVMNRVKSGKFPDTLEEVIYQPGQFEPVSNGQINLRPTDSALRAAELAAAGEDPTGGALYFFAPAKTANSFLWSRPHKVTIGKHRFTG